jgi:hypothetical protein
MEFNGLLLGSSGGVHRQNWVQESTARMKAQQVHPDATTPGAGPEPGPAAAQHHDVSTFVPKPFVGAAKPVKLENHLPVLNGDDFAGNDLDMGGNAAVKESLPSNEAPEMDETRKQLEDLQIRTIFSLVEDIELDIGGQTAQKKLLFLTNKQARKFDFSNISKVLQAMDVSPMPQLVINLFCSLAHVGQDRPHGVGDGHWLNKMSQTLGRHWHAETSAADVHSTDRRLMHFLKTCVLPVAIQTNALVLVHGDNCSLAHAFSELCCAEVQKMGGGRLPFTVLCIYQAVDLSNPSNRIGTVAHGLKTKSKRWTEREHAIEAANFATYGDEGIGQSHFTDLPLGATHFIIVDSVTSGMLDASARVFFKNSLVQQVSENLPSIAIQTFDKGGMSVVPVLQDYAGRGLPLLLLDTRPRSTGTTYPSSISEATREIEVLELLLQSVGATNTYLMSLVAYLRRVVDKAGDSSTSSSAGTAQPHAVPLHERLEEERVRELQEQQALSSHLINGTSAENGRRNSAAQPRASKHTVAAEAVSIIEKQVQQIERHRFEQLREQLESVLAELDCTETLTVPQLRSLVQGTSCSLRGSWASAEGKDASFAHKHPKHFCLKRGMKDGKLWVRILCLDDSMSDMNLEDARAMYHTFVSAWRDELTVSAGKQKQLARKVYTGLLDLFQLDCVYSNNLDDTHRITQTIASVAKIDRLPSENSVEALVILQSAWDRVDMYSRTAKQCKKVTKALYVCLLLIGFIVSTITVVSLNERLHSIPGDEALIDADTLSQAVIGLSLFGSLVGSVVSFMNPGLRWQQLRGAALSLECEIWRFRTRTGQYSTSTKAGFGRYSKEAERKLLSHLETINEHVSQSATVMETTFFSNVELFGDTTRAGFYSHGQYPPSGMCGTFGMSHEDDDHYSPLKPQDYLKYRIKPTSRFYQNKLPLYYRTRAISEMLLLFSMFAGTILAFMKLSEWAALATSFSAATAAWKGFAETDKKLSRYSNTVEKLASTVLWWRQLSEVEQASLSKVDVLISTCEGIFEREHDAWLSTSLVSMLDQAASGDTPAGKAQAPTGGSGSDIEAAGKNARTTTNV